ncbi:MAG: recombinase family protein [Rhodospirillaceae bacterium]|nr:recombinase family protein [Rhodospirillaceae bacterium]MDE0253713.1 recombinase family protein [Rhodospirillaceae bacterium]MDE0619144.1 recombinase family protein [Rhodospirillaceae bacterium]
MAACPNPTAAARPDRSSPKRPAAGYLRSAKELEGDSLRRQIEAIVRYARDHGMQLTRLYCDEYGSGLSIDGRTGLQQLFRDIASGAGDFDTILLLDPSRWGRFQDPDQSACIENACRQAGVEVRYCAEEHLDHEDRAWSATARRLKRYMADEYKRELAARERRAATTEGDGDANPGANPRGGAGAGPDVDVARPPAAR